MAKNISLLGADYPDVPAVVLPKTGGGSATFVDADDIGNVEEALAIVVNGDTAPKAITAGQYLFIKNHSTLATGGYHATADISSGGTVSVSNVTADVDGISNSINSKATTIGSKIDTGEHYAAANTAVTINCPGGARFMLFCVSGDGSAAGIISVIATGAGAVTAVKVAGCSGTTINTATTNKLKVTQSANTYMFFVNARTASEKPSFD